MSHQAAYQCPCFEGEKKKKQLEKQNFSITCLWSEVAEAKGKAKSRDTQCEQLVMH